MKSFRRLSAALCFFCAISSPLAMNHLAAQDREESSQDAEKADAEPPANWTKLFSSEKFESTSGKSLAYRQMNPPTIADGERYPLVLFLHGAGERGQDNQAQLKHGLREFAARRDSFPAFVVAPQCPSGQTWSLISRNSDQQRLPAEPYEPMSLCRELLDQLLEKLPIDPERVYITGLSMGGYGTFDAATRWPELFAAAAPICGGGDDSPEAMEKLKSIPFWIVHGDNDRVIPVERSRQMVQGLKQAGVEPIYHELPGVGHDSWTAAYSNEAFFEWLFAQRRSR